MTLQECNSCGGIKSIYGPSCNDCQNRESFIVSDDDESKRESLSHPKKKKKRKILSTLDILISVFIVTPLVVACWRGTWQLLDIYADYFPPWETFIIGK